VIGFKVISILIALLLGICRKMGVKFTCAPTKWDILKQYEDEDMARWYTPDEDEATVHVVAMNNLSPTSLVEYLRQRPQFSHLLSIKPTGWAHTDKQVGRTAINQTATSLKGQQSIVSAFFQKGSSHTSTIVSGTDSAFRIESSQGPGGPVTGSRAMYMSDLVLVPVASHVCMVSAPYSEHSSYQELRQFVLGLNVRKIIPTVNLGNSKERGDMMGILERWQQERRLHGRSFQWDAKGSENDLTS
jgi:DNA cross-link repair 1A protein